MSITVHGKKDGKPVAEVTIDKDLTGDSQINWDDIQKAIDDGGIQEAKVTIAGKSYDWNSIQGKKEDVNKLVADSADYPFEEVTESNADRQLREISSELETLKNDLDGVEKKLKSLKDKTDPTDAEKAEKVLLESRQQAASRRKEQLLEQYKSTNRTLSQKNGGSRSDYEGLSDSVKKFFGLSDSKLSSAKASVTSGGGGSGPKASHTGSGNGAGGARGAGGGAPFGDFTMPFDSAAFGRALVMDGLRLDGLGAMFESQAKSRRLMELFFFFMRMAASGDLMAIAQLVRFVATVISMDEALEIGHTSMGLFKLQDQRRERNKELDQFLTADPEDKEADRNLSIMLNQMRAEDAITGTSEKILSDKLNTSTGIIDALTGAYKSVLERAIANLQFMSRFRA